jgi:hypothetical protein
MAIVRISLVLGLLVVGTGAAPYEVRRSEFSDQTHSSPVHAETDAPSFDDAVGVLYDGTTYFYLVNAADGTPLTLTVSRLESQATVRLGIVGELSGRELAAAELDTASDDGGAFDEMTAGLDPEEDPGADKVAEAREQVEEAVTILEDPDTSNDEDALSNFLKGAVGELMAALDDPGEVDPALIAETLDLLVEMARMVAVHHLEAAWANCGVCFGDDPAKVCEAEEALQEGDDERLESEPDLESVVGYYATSVDKALESLDECD